MWITSGIEPAQEISEKIVHSKVLLKDEEFTYFYFYFDFNLIFVFILLVLEHTF